MACQPPLVLPASATLKRGSLDSANPTFLMAIKKSNLYSSLWASCDELRGCMDEVEQLAAKVAAHLAKMGGAP